MPRSFLVDRAAELLGVSRRTVYYRIREGKLRTIRTRGGSQRVLLESIDCVGEVVEIETTARADDVSGTDPSGKSPAT